MPTTKTGYWVRVKDGQVKDVWDYAPSDELRATQSGWSEAVEIFPDLVDGREMLTTHSIDITATPIEIVWSKRELTVDERKGSLKAGAQQAFRDTVNAELRKEIDEFPDTQYDAAVVASAQTTYENAVTAINALATHEDVDAYSA